MRHILVACADPSLVDALREAADASTTFLPEEGVDEALERLGRSSRIDAVVTESADLLAAVREEIPGEIPVHLRARDEPIAETLAALERLLGA